MWLEAAKRSLVQDVTETTAIEQGESKEFKVTRKGLGPITTTEDELEFFVYDFEVDDKWENYLVAVKAPVVDSLQPKFDSSKPIKLRIDSGCLTGQVLHDNTCECREQMHEALKRISEHGQGILISIPAQDGRGRGMPFKLATLILQKELNMDTVRASAYLDPEGERDERTYGGAIAVLHALGLEPGAELVHLSNNGDKHAVLRENKFSVRAEPLNAGHTKKNLHHLRAKRDDLGHEGLDPDAENKDSDESGSEGPEPHS
jgi:GTP cyclohydrolase II